MSDELLALLWRSTVASSVAALVVFAVRRSLRRAFGSGVAYVAWLAVPLGTFAILIPAPAVSSWTLPIVTAAYSKVPAVLMQTAAPPPAWSWTILIVWGVGVVAAVAWQVHLQHLFVRSLGRLVVTGDLAVSESLVASPSLVGFWRPVIALPADFSVRYTPHERELVIAHERAHARHGDPFVNACCAVLQCIWWFDPIAHLAARAVRADQEMARDAEVLLAYPHSRHAYANALLKAQLAASHAPIACQWRSRHPLKERMMQLNRTTSAVLRRVGTSMVAFGMLGATYAAWAAQAATDVDPGRASNVRWMNARPAITLKLEAGPQPSHVLVSAIVTDLATGSVLSRPRLLTVPGDRATIEIGAAKNDRGVGIRIGVTIHPSGRDAEYTNEVLRNGRVESSQSGTLALTPIDPAAASAEATGHVDPQAGPYLFELSFSSSDAKELACAADAFTARGNVGLAEAMRAPVDGKVHTASFATTTPSLNADAKDFVAALSKCQLGIDSNLAWSMKPGRIARD